MGKSAKCVCADCGTVFRTPINNRRTRCLPCATQFAITCAREQSARSGAAWDRTVRGSLRYWWHEAARIGLLDLNAPEDPPVF